MRDDLQGGAKPGEANSHPQVDLPFPGYAVQRGEARQVLDLFAGLGGLSLGFSRNGFSVTGVDREPLSAEVFRLNRIGDPITADLGSSSANVKTPVIIGGPPCRPWSVMNVQRRRADHDQHGLLSRFFDHVEGLEPMIFLMENVPGIRRDPVYHGLVQRIASKYSVRARTVRYSEFGAATSRRRLFTVGIRRGRVTADDFFHRLEKERQRAATVKEAIGWLREYPRGGFPDHEWSQLTTIEKYTDHYSDGRFGWKKLEYGVAAPSFGSVAKTYILHPEAGIDGFPTRVVSVREVLSIMGFEPGFSFPEGTSRALRYQMSADAVSPIFSAACARAVRDLLWRDTPETRSHASHSERSVT